MKTAQARASVETLRDVQNDKALKTKAEKDRRIRKHFLSGIIFSYLEKYPFKSSHIFLFTTVHFKHRADFSSTRASCTVLKLY